MIDSHALVGSCAQIGRRVHLSAAAQMRIALLYSNPSASYLSEILMGILDQASRNDIHLVVERCRFGVDEQEVLGRLVKSGINGFLLPSPLCDETALLEMLHPEVVPADRPIPPPGRTSPRPARTSRRPAGPTCRSARRAWTPATAPVCSTSAPSTPSAGRRWPRRTSPASSPSSSRPTRRPPRPRSRQRSARCPSGRATPAGSPAPGRCSGIGRWRPRRSGRSCGVLVRARPPARPRADPPRTPDPGSCRRAPRSGTTTPGSPSTSAASPPTWRWPPTGSSATRSGPAATAR